MITLCSDFPDLLLNCCFSFPAIPAATPGKKAKTVVSKIRPYSTCSVKQRTSGGSSYYFSFILQQKEAKL